MVRFSVYNVENLFSRPKVLNMADHERAAAILKDIARLTELLNKADYMGHAAEIKALYVKLKDYVYINIRSSKVGRYIISAEGDLIAMGREDWDGFVDLKRERFQEEQVQFTGKVITTVKADIQCFVEVESADTLARFNTDILAAYFKDKIVVDGNDPRGIDVGLASRKGYPIETARTNVFAYDAKGTIFSRDCLEVELSVNGRRLFVLANHFKAKDRNRVVSDDKRKRQAKRVAEILESRYDLDRDLVIVAGDLNDEPDSDPISPLYKVPGLFHAFDVTNHPADDRWTYYYGRQKQRNAIDYVFVSAALRKHVKAAGIERRGIADLATITKGAQQSFPGITSWRLAGSDHAAVWVDFDL
jgi:endonuclease/exonuclease/phosphatase family metal-dependent hydrolase